MGDQISAIWQKMVALVRARWRAVRSNFGRELSMEGYLHWSNVIFLLIATIIGILVGINECLKSYFSEKNFYAICLIVVFFIIYLVIEIGAIRKLPHTVRGIGIKRNPMLKLFIFQILLIVLAGWFVLSRFVLDNFWSYLTLSLLSASFVAGIFETFRYLRGKSLWI
jgi:hypothetical protein